MALMIAAIIGLGLAPQPVLNTMRPSVESIIQGLGAGNSNSAVAGTPGSLDQGGAP
jgi:NADH:ubiquinone oxidoreductase subunit 4 (subunit M)